VRTRFSIRAPVALRERGWSRPQPERHDTVRSLAEADVG
jgi:hypothetical protein